MSLRIAAMTARILLAVLFLVHGTLAGASARAETLATESGPPMTAPLDPMPCCADPATEAANCAGACAMSQAILPRVALPVAPAAAPAFGREETWAETRRPGFEPPPPRSASA